MFPDIVFLNIYLPAIYYNIVGGYIMLGHNLNNTLLSLTVKSCVCKLYEKNDEEHN